MLNRNTLNKIEKKYRLNKKILKIKNQVSSELEEIFIDKDINIDFLLILRIPEMLIFIYIMYKFT